MPVVPTLEMMADVYRLDRAGGADSLRFRRYVELAASHPVQTYNPMTGKPEALETVEALIEAEAESIAGELSGGRVLSLSVLTPGAWTDRAFTEIDMRVKGHPLVWFWAGESIDRSVVVARTRSQMTRLRWQEHNGPPDTMRRLSAQEAFALHAAGVEVEGDADLARGVFSVVADERDMGTLIGWLLGDEAAEAAGYRGLGLADGDGVGFCLEWVRSLRDREAALEGGFLPT